MIVDQTFEKARFSFTDASGQRRVVTVNFNPASLDYTITSNTRGEGGRVAQVVGTSSAKLNMELIFDTTDTGEDVRGQTHEIELMLQPGEGTGGRNAPRQVAPSVLFEWGAFQFEGVVDSFRQTMDFFAANGVPLRAAVALSLSNQNYQFDQQDSGRGTNVAGGLVLGGGNPGGIAALGGDPSAARLIASANGLESLRAEAGVALSVGGPVSIGAAVGFSAGGGIGAGVGVSFGVGAGAFAGLQTGVGAAGGRHFDARKIFSEISASAVSSGASFDVTGKVISPGTAGFKAEVGGTGKIRFDD